MSQAVPQQSTTDTSNEWSLQLTSDSELTDKNFPIPKDKTSILGRDPDVDVVIPLSAISRRHAELTISQGRLKIKDLGSINGTYLNDEKIAEAFAKPGDRIRFEKVCFELLGPETPTLAATTVSPVVTDSDLMASTQVMTIVPGLLVGLTQPIRKKEFALSGLKQTIGRDKSNDIVLEHVSVSSRHAEMTYLDGEWLVRDLGSTNGTFIDGHRIDDQSINDKSVDKANLKPGQQLSIAGVCLEYRLHNESTTGMPKVTHVSSDEQPRKRSRLPLALTGLAIACLLLLLIFPPDAIEHMLPRHQTLTGVQDYAQDLSNELGGEQTLPPLSLTATWPALALPSNRALNSPTLMDLDGDHLAEVVVTDAQGFVSAIDGQSGQSLFSIQLSSKIIAPPASLKIAGSAAIVVARYDGRIEALNREGQSLWTSNAGLELGRLVQRPMILDVNNDQQKDIVLASDSKGLVALDGSRDGWLLWHTAHLQRGRVSALPLAADINRDQQQDFVTVSDQGQVLAVTIDKGVPRKLWEQQLAPILFAAPTLVSHKQRELIIVATHQGELLALSGKTGALVWQTPHPKALFASPLSGDLTGDGKTELLTVSHDGEITVYEGHSGKQLWQQNIDSQVQSSPLLFDINQDRGADLVLLDGDGYIHFINGRDGEPLMDHLQPEGADSFITSPLLGDINGDRRGDLIAASQNGQIIALTLNRRLPLGSTPWPQLLGNDTHSYRK